MPLLSPLLATAMLLWADPPALAQSTVELRVTSIDEGDAKLLEHVLMRQLVDRLIEDGYRVVPAGESANVRVWIHLGPDAATIQTHGTDQRTEQIADGDPHVMALELQQLTIAMIDEVRPPDVQPRTAVMIDMIDMIDSQDPQLREHLQIGLLERGFALTRAPTRDDLRLCVVVAASGVLVDALAGADRCQADGSATHQQVGPQPNPELERELVLDQAIASIGGFDRPAPPAVAEPLPIDLPPIDAEPSIEQPSPSKPQPRPSSITAAASGGLLGRGGGPDPIVGVELRAGRRHGIGGGLALAVVPSRAEALRVIEFVPTATFDWRLGFANRGLAMLGLFAGAHIHSYTHVGSSERANRIGPSVGASGRLAFLGTRGVLLFGGVRAGWSGTRAIHVINGELSWRRHGVMIGLELGAGWDFSLGGRR